MKTVVTFIRLEPAKTVRVVGVALAALLLAGAVGAANATGAAGARGAQSQVNKSLPPKATTSQSPVVTQTNQTTTNGYHPGTDGTPTIVWGRGPGQQTGAISPKAAEKAAKKLNKIEQKAAKRADKDNKGGNKGNGVRDDGSGNCGPDSSTLC